MTFKRLFCGSGFDSQNTSFEHVIPTWLVHEADLKKRKMEVQWRSLSRKVDMNRVGSKVCHQCNEAFGELEDFAKPIFGKVRDGEVISTSEQELLLLWFDKFRLSLWLWYWQAGRNDFRSSPNFHVAQRMGQKDHVLLINRYPNYSNMKGMSFDGFGEVFAFTPSALGILINNISFVTISTDFFLARHLQNLHVQQSPVPGGQIRFVPRVRDNPSPRITVLGNPLILGQSVLPEQWFDKLGFKKKGKAFHHALGGISAARTETYRLNADLSIASLGPVHVDTFTGSIEANLALASINRSNAVRLMLRDLLAADFSLFENSAEAVAAKKEVQMLHDAEAVLSRVATEKYRRASGIVLPTVFH